MPTSEAYRLGQISDDCEAATPLAHAQRIGRPIRARRKVRAPAAILASFLTASTVLAGTFSDRATLSLRDLTGEPQSITDYSGLVIVLNFWATWCVPCREEMPLLAEVQERYADRGVVVIGASADDASTRDKIEEFVQGIGISFPIWTGATTIDTERFGLGTALPVTAIIDQQGRVAFRIVGILKRRQVVSRIEYLISGQRGRAPKRFVNSMPDEIGQDAASGHAHEEGEDHAHGGVGMEGASLVPS